MAAQSHDHLITSLSALHEHYGEPSPIARDKVLPQLDEHCCRYVAHAPFLVLSSMGQDGKMDASPRGDKPGFVQVDDPHTILIPDRPGTRRVDSIKNIVVNPGVGLLFLVPGINETLRVNGYATISTDPHLLQRFKVGQRLPLSVVVVKVGEAFLHCAKALVRSGLWDSTRHTDRSEFPPLGKMLADQIAGLDPVAAEDQVQHSMRNRMY